MNTKNLIIAIVAILIIIIGGIYYWNYYKSFSLPGIGPLSTVSQGSNQISIKNFAFSPAELNIRKGDKVTWINNDSAMHTIQGSRIQMSYSEIQSENLSSGQSFSFTFNNAGIYDYFCSIHPSMKGKIIIE